MEYPSEQPGQRPAREMQEYVWYYWTNPSFKADRPDNERDGQRESGEQGTANDASSEPEADNLQVVLWLRFSLVHDLGPQFHPVEILIELPGQEQASTASSSPFPKPTIGSRSSARSSAPSISPPTRHPG